MATPPAPACELAVAIPVHNEEADIEGTLRALAAQVDLAGHALDPDRYEVLVFANNCTDGTGGGRAPVRRRTPPPPPAPNRDGPVRAARARRRGAAAWSWTRPAVGWRAWGGPGASSPRRTATPGCAPRWIAANLFEITDGAEAVGGRILAEPGQIAALSEGTRRYYRLDTTYRTLRAAYETILNPGPGNPWPRHHHCFGASLAVTAETYRAAGGLPVIRLPGGHGVHRRPWSGWTCAVRQSPAGERADLAARLRAGGGGASRAPCPSGRARRPADEPLLLESPDAIAREARNRRYLRERWQPDAPADAVRRAAGRVEVDADWLAQHWKRAQSGGRTLPDGLLAPSGNRDGPLRAAGSPRRGEAIAELRRRVSEHRDLLRTASVKPAQTDLSGTFPPVDPADAADVRPWPLPQRLRGPDRRSADSRAQTASNEPATGGHPLPVR